jgi:uncharacterized membrane protein
MAGEDLTNELSDQDRVLLVFDYLGPLALVSLVATRREFVKWHAKQGLVLAVALIALYVLLRPVQLLLDRYFWAVLGELFRVGFSLVALGGVVLLLLCIIRALEGERFKVPLLGDLADRL